MINNRISKRKFLSVVDLCTMEITLWANKNIEHGPTTMEVCRSTVTCILLKC